MNRSFRDAILVLILVAAVYANALPNGFVYDDWDLIVRNGWLERGPLIDAFRLGYWETSRGGSFYYRPLVSLAYWVDYRIWGAKPPGYHLTNLILHAIASLLVLALARRWLVSRGAGLAAAALFAVHPIHTQSVTWIAGRTDLLAAVFFLLALYLQQISFERSGRGPRGSLWAGSLASLASALLSKEIAVIYPAALALHVRLISRAGGAAGAGRPAPGRSISGKPVALAGPLVASSVVVAAYLGLRLAVIGRLAGYADDPHAWWRAADGTLSRLLAVPSILAFYLRRFLYPYWLGFESGIEPVREVTSRSFWMPAAGLILLAVLAWRYTRRDPALPFGLGWLLVTLIPVANVFPIFESAMEHFAYLPSVGLVAAAAAFGRAVLRARTARVAACCLLVALLGARTVVRNGDWKDEETFWRVTIHDTPSARAWNNLGLLLKEEGRLDEAARALTWVQILRPDLPSSYANLGAVAAARGRRAEAIDLFRRALALSAADADALYNLALVLETNERGTRYGPGFPAAEAIAAYRALLAAHPRHAEGWTNLGVLYEVSLRPIEAEGAFQRAIEAKADLPEPHAFLGSLLWERGEKGRAADLYRRYLALAPSGEYAAEARSRSSP